MKMNKYLKDIGFDERNLIGSYKEGNENISKYEGYAIADCRNQEDEEGFVPYEFFSLDHTFDLFIFSKMSYFREHIAPLATPSCFLNVDEDKDKNEAGHQLWLSVIDKIVDGFRLALVGNLYSGEDRFKIEEARRLFITYYNCFWY